LWHPIYP